LDSWTAQRLVSCLVGTAVVVLIGVLGRRVAGDRAGVFAAGLAALYPVLITADGSLMSETFYGLFVVLALFAAYRLLERPTRRHARALGLVIGLAALTRAEGWLLLPLLAAPVCWRGRHLVRGWDRRLAAAAIATVLVILPWTIRNWAVFSRPVVISTNGSAVIGGANCDATYKGADIGLWRIDCLATSPPGENEAKAASRWQRSGLGYARRHIGRGMVVAAVRLLRTWNLYQPGRRQMVGEGRDPGVQRVGIVMFFLLLPLAGYGIALLRRRGASLLILVVPAIMVSITSILGFGYPRFRHAAEIPLMVLAGLALSRLIPEGTTRRDAGKRHPAGSNPG
jgi:4-amino-4-deoxy-L-arabinose transferase-like glycosyltransferase